MRNHLTTSEWYWIVLISFQLTNIFPQLRSFGYFCGPIWKQLFWKCQCLLLLSNKRWHHNIFRKKACNILSVLFMSNMFEYYYYVLAIITYPLCHVFLYFWNKYFDGSCLIIFFLILAMTKQGLFTGWIFFQPVKNQWLFRPVFSHGRSHKWYSIYITRKGFHDGFCYRSFWDGDI